MSEFIEVSGFKWPKYGFAAENFQKVQEIKLRAEDIVIDAYPKCGNTWLSYIVWGILNDGATPPQPTEMKDHVPFVDMMGTELLDASTSCPRVMFTHVPPPYFPIKPEVKYITVFRNPFDTCVSYYHFSTARKRLAQGVDHQFDEFFENFLVGKSAFGDFFQTFNSWYSFRAQPNVLLLTYEQLLADQVTGVKKVAAFIGQEYARKLDTDPTMLEKIVRHSSFDFMKKKLDFILTTPASGPQKINFFRKGIVGDWENHFSEDQKKRLNERMQREMAGTETLELWNKILPI